MSPLARIGVSIMNKKTQADCESASTALFRPSGSLFEPDECYCDNASDLTCRHCLEEQLIEAEEKGYQNGQSDARGCDS